MHEYIVSTRRVGFGRRWSIGVATTGSSEGCSRGPSVVTQGTTELRTSIADVAAAIGVSSSYVKVMDSTPSSTGRLGISDIQKDK
jgi:hypothetical protein